MAIILCRLCQADINCGSSIQYVHAYVAYYQQLQYFNAGVTVQLKHTAYYVIMPAAATPPYCYVIVQYVKAVGRLRRGQIKIP